MQELLLDKTHDEARQGEPFTSLITLNTHLNKYFYIESYGCAMNFADSEVVASILQQKGYASTPDTTLADLILINTCSIREKAEEKVRQRLTTFRLLKKNRPGLVIAVLGCMAERLKGKF